jgi:hypothetical protein
MNYTTKQQYTQPFHETLSPFFLAKIIQKQATHRATYFGGMISIRLFNLPLISCIISISINKAAMRRYVRWYIMVILHFGPSKILKSTHNPCLSTIFCILAPGPEWRRQQPMPLSHAAATGTGAVATAAEALHGGIRRSPPERRSHHGGIHGARRRHHGPSALPPLPSRSEALVSPNPQYTPRVSPHGAPLPSPPHRIPALSPPTGDLNHL